MNAPSERDNSEAQDDRAAEIRAVADECLRRWIAEGRISHEEGVKLWFASRELPHAIQAKIDELEEAGYLSKEMVAELLARETWTKEELIWIFSNAPRPEA